MGHHVSRWALAGAVDFVGSLDVRVSVPAHHCWPAALTALAGKGRLDASIATMMRGSRALPSNYRFFAELELEFEPNVVGDEALFEEPVTNRPVIALRPRTEPTRQVPLLICWTDVFAVDFTIELLSTTSRYTPGMRVTASSRRRAQWFARSPSNWYHASRS